MRCIRDGFVVGLAGVVWLTPDMWRLLPGDMAGALAGLFVGSAMLLAGAVLSGGPRA